MIDARKQYDDENDLPIVLFDEDEEFWVNDYLAFAYFEINDPGTYTFSVNCRVLNLAIDNSNEYEEVYDNSLEKIVYMIILLGSVFGYVIYLRMYRKKKMMK